MQPLLPFLHALVLACAHRNNWIIFSC